MRTAIVIPWRANGPTRDALRIWTLNRYSQAFPWVEIVDGGCDPDLPFNRSAAIVDGAEKTDADILIVADADCWSDGIHEAVASVEAGEAWAIPHLMLCRLTETATARVLAGERPEDQVDFAERPYKGHPAGTLLVIRRDVLFDVPPDVRMVGWGSEDDAWALALQVLVAPPWRGTAPCWHLWHPPQPRRSRGIGNEANFQLYRRYKAARHSRDRMRQLIDEAKGASDARLHGAPLDGEPVPHR